MEKGKVSRSSSRGRSMGRSSRNEGSSSRATPPSISQPIPIPHSQPVPSPHSQPIRSPGSSPSVHSVIPPQELEFDLQQNETQPFDSTTRHYGRDPVDGKTWIIPEGDTFYPVVDVVREITEIIQSNFDTTCFTWGELDEPTKEMWWGEWTKRYKWLPQHDLQIKKNWKQKTGKLFRSMMHNVRMNLEKKNKRPIWIQSELLDQMIAKWNSDEYKLRQEQARRNRASVKGGTVNYGGSIPQSEHKRRMMKETGEEPTLAQIFLRTHQKQGTDEFIDQRSADAYAAYQRIKSARSSQASAEGVLDDVYEDAACWIEAVGGRSKKGRIFGAGSQTRSIQNYSSSSSSSQNSWIHPDFEHELQNRVAQMRDDMRGEIRDDMEKIKDDHKVEIERRDQVIEELSSRLKSTEEQMKLIMSRLNVGSTSTFAERGDGSRDSDSAEDI